MPRERLSPAVGVEERNGHTIKTGRLIVAMACAWGKRKPLDAQASKKGEYQTLNSLLRRIPRRREMVVEVASNDHAVGSRGLTTEEDMQDSSLVRRRQVKIPKTNRVGPTARHDLQSAPSNQGAGRNALPAAREKGGDTASGCLAPGGAGW